jgi:exopolyphosphatase/pppGpp-phosphohydrolase
LRFVLSNTESGGARAAARVREAFGDPIGTICTQLQDLQANFADSSTQGISAYINQHVDVIGGDSEERAVVAATRAGRCHRISDDDLVDRARESQPSSTQIETRVLPILLRIPWSSQTPHFHRIGSPVMSVGVGTAARFPS